MTQRGANQIANGDRRQIGLGAARLEPDQVGRLQLQLCGVFDDDEAILGRQSGDQGVEERGLPGAGSPLKRPVAVLCDSRWICRRTIWGRAGAGRRDEGAEACATADLARVDNSQAQVALAAPPWYRQSLQRAGRYGSRDRLIL